MINHDVFDKASEAFIRFHGSPHAVAAYAPGRMEILGNHTDYNGGAVLSAAIDRGTFFLAAPSPDASCRLMAADLNENTVFDLSAAGPSTTAPWANYVKGILAKLRERASINHGFNGLLTGNIPLGAGLSSSAALEMASGLALCELYGIALTPIELARIGQAAEHEYAGAKCGLLDQISSLFGKEHRLVWTDFRTLTVKTVPFPEQACFILVNTHVKHRLVDSEYNERRQSCEKATRFFATVLGRPISVLCDVTGPELARHAAALDPISARRAAHVIGENERVRKAVSLLECHALAALGELMFESHRSSRVDFENSCPELDTLVDAARNMPGAMGARLSGGGFGGSVVVLVRPPDADPIGDALQSVYRKAFGRPCDVLRVAPSLGAQVI